MRRPLATFLLAGLPFLASCRAGYEPPLVEALGHVVEAKVGRIEWAVADALPEKIMLFKPGPRLLDLGFVEALAREHGIPKSKTIPEDMGPLSPGAASYEDYNEKAPKALYYQPASGTFILGLDPSGGFSTFAERVNDDWPGLPNAEEAYDMALALFPKVGLKAEDFAADSSGRLVYTVSNKFLGWLDAKQDRRRREPTTITLKFYRKIGGHRVASSGQGGCALFEFGPHKKLMSVEWRMHSAEPLGEVRLKGSKAILADIKKGRSYGSKAELNGDVLTIKRVEIRPHEGRRAGQEVFYPLYEASGTLTKGAESAEVSLLIPALP
jgi:hypothetical protein